VLAVQAAILYAGVPAITNRLDLLFCQLYLRLRVMRDQGKGDEPQGEQKRFTHGKAPYEVAVQNSAWACEGEDNPTIW
jgi:hypothetical protein